MGTLEELVAATKLLGEYGGKEVEKCDVTGVSHMELGDNGVDVSEMNEVGGSGAHSFLAATKRTEKIVETTSRGEGRLQNYSTVEEKKGKLAERVKLASSDDKSVLRREEECDRSGINLIVDVLGSLDAVEGTKKTTKTNGDKGSSTENGEGLNITCVLEITSGDHKEEANGEVAEKQEHGFRVGDFVWGKIRSHPWWPGQIYDTKDASNFAMKYSQSGRLLVAFFGDGSCSWCLPAQLIPFADYFQEMSQESSSNSFLNAVQRSTDEIGRVLESKMTCKCISKDNKVGLDPPLVVNAGLKPGVLRPEIDIRRLSVPIYEPAEVLAKVKNFAQDPVSIGSTLDLAVLKSWLSSYYRLKGGHQLPVYREAHQIEGLEDSSQIRGVIANDFNGAVEGQKLGPLDDDWNSSPTGGMGQSQGPSGDKIHRKRKQKSVAELLGETTEIKLNSKRRTADKDETDLVKSTSTTKKKNKGTDGENSGSHDAGLTRRSGKRKGWISGCSGITEKENKFLNAGSVDVGSVEKSNSGPELGTSRGNEVSAVDSIVREEVNGEPEMASTPRERKKSKYLSPPYTIGKKSSENSKSKRESEIESEKIIKIARVGECMTKAAGELIPSPSSAHPVSAEVIPSRQQNGVDSSHDTSYEHDENALKKIFDTVNAGASGNGVLSRVQSAAVDPLYLSKEGSLDIVRRFFSAFRNSIHLEGSSGAEFHKQQGEGRKILHSEPENHGNDLSKMKTKTPGPRVHKVGNKEIDEATSNTIKPNTTAQFSGPKMGTEEIDGRASSSSLVLTFSPGFTLPSKDEIIRMFGKFGSLNAKETKVETNKNSIQVVYVNNSDAEEALRSSAVGGLFGSAILNCRLLNSSATPEKPNSSQLANDVISDMGFIKQKLEAMTSMLENCGCKFSPNKSSLKDEMKHLLEKVGTAVDKVKTITETVTS